MCASDGSSVELFAADGLHRSGGVFPFDRAIADDDDFAEHAARLQTHIEGSGSADGHGHRPVASVADLQFRSLVGKFQGKTTIYVGGGASIGTYDEDVGADEWFTGLGISDFATDGSLGVKCQGQQARQ